MKKELKVIIEDTCEDCPYKEFEMPSCESDKWTCNHPDTEFYVISFDVNKQPTIPHWCPLTTIEY